MVKQTKKRKKAPKKIEQSRDFHAKPAAPKMLLGNLNTGGGFNNAPKRAPGSSRKR